MRKEVLTSVLLLFFIFGINAQPLVSDKNPIDFFGDWKSIATAGLFGGSNVQHGLNLGLSASTPVNSANKVVPFGILLDANYLYQSRRAIAFGVATGYAMYFRKDTNENWGPLNKDSDFRYVPVAMATRYALNSGFVIGADLGYAFILSDNWNGGIYYRPIIGYNISKITQLNVSYSGIADNWVWSTVSFGLTVNLNG